MARVNQLNRKNTAEEAGVMVVRDRFAPVDPETGEWPALLSKDGRPCTLSVLGNESRVAKRFDMQKDAAFQNRLIARSVGAALKSRRGRTTALPTVAVTVDDVIAQKEAELDKLAGVTVDWYGFEDDDDQPVPFSTEAVRALYVSNPDIVAQVMEFLIERDELGFTS